MKICFGKSLSKAYFSKQTKKNKLELEKEEKELKSKKKYRY
jgi:hypothetical protein